MPYKFLVRLTAVLFGGLCLGLLLVPGLFAAVFGLDPSTGAEVMARRAGMVFAGLAPLYLALSRVTDPDLQRGIARASLLMMAGLVLLGLLEWFAGRVGPGILFPVVIEAILVIGYAPHVLRQEA
ncbi:MAG: hypothetical protein ACKO2N_03955 [Tabrizicola sp.]